MMPVHLFDLVDLTGVDVEVGNGLGPRRELGRNARHTVVKACAHGDQEVAVVHRVVGIGGAMHAQHVQAVRFGGVVAADPHQCGGDRDAESLGEAAQRLGGLAVKHAAAGVDQRAA
jgi:hypothetical protein